MLGRLNIASALAVAVTAALAVAGCGDSKTATPSTKSGATDAAKKTVVDALSRTSEIESGQVKMSVDTGSKVPVKITASGPFDITKTNAPKFDLDLVVDASTKNGKTKQAFGIAAIGGKTYFGLSGAYFDLTAAGSSGGLGDVGKSLDPGQLRFYATAFGKHLKNVKPSGTSTVDGQSIKNYTGEIDLAGAVETVQKLSGRPAASLPLYGLDQFGDPNKLKNSVKYAELTIGVGSDGLVHSGLLKGTFTGLNGQRPLTISLTVEQLNKPVKIAKPDNVVAGNSSKQLLDSLGENSATR